MCRRMLIKIILFLGIVIAIYPAGGTFAEINQDPIEPYKQCVGWYEVAPGRFNLVTWGARSGLLILDFERVSFGRLSPSGDNLFVWRRGKESPEREVSFTKNKQGEVTGFSWRDQDGGQGMAKKSTSYGYSQEEVRFKNGSVTLTGLVMMPRTKGPHPAAAIIQGSGDSDRDNVWAFTIADYMARQGIAVLLPDKRGSGKSEGDWHTADFKDLAGDALAALEVLKARKEVDPNRAGLVGLSQGGWIAPLAASLSRDVAFVVDVSGAAVTPGEQVAHELEQDYRRSGLNEPVIKGLLELIGLSQNYMRTGTGWEAYQEKLNKTWSPFRKPFPATKDDWRWDWWRAVIDFDPIPLLEEARCPVFVAYGQEDEKDNVPVKESVTRLEKMIQRAKKKDFIIKVYPGSGHAIDDPATKWVSKDFLDFLSRWIIQEAKG